MGVEKLDNFYGDLLHLKVVEHEYWVVYGLLTLYMLEYKGLDVVINIVLKTGFVDIFITFRR